MWSFIYEYDREKQIALKTQEFQIVMIGELQHLVVFLTKKRLGAITAS
jgi:hypothetical protein